MHAHRTIRLLAPLLALAIAPPALAQQVRTVQDHELCRDRNRNQEDYCEVRELTLDAGRLEVDAGSNGGVRVEGWDRDEILVEARIGTRARSDDDAEELAQRVRVRVDGRHVEADGPSTRNHESWWVSFRVHVPRSTDLDLETSNGGVAIESVSGRIRFRTSNGGVSLTDLGGDVQGSTANGGLSVHLTGDRWQGDGLDVRTSNGGVRLYVPEGYSAHLETGTVNGRVDIDFPITLQGRLSGDIEVDLGSGGPPVRVHTTNGPVRVLRPDR